MIPFCDFLEKVKLQAKNTAMVAYSRVVTEKWLSTTKCGEIFWVDGIVLYLGCGSCYMTTYVSKVTEDDHLRPGI
jgi:hypothetical protein